MPLKLGVGEGIVILCRDLYGERKREIRWIVREGESTGESNSKLFFYFYR